jgi:acetyltransferase
MNNLSNLLEPQSIAVVGVSDDLSRPGSQAVRALLANGYKGRIFPVNPKYPTFEGLRCYGSIADIDDAVDLVVIGVPAPAVLPVIEACAAKRVPFAVVLSGGFRESGPEGIERERRMLEIARQSGLRILGPNCLGFANIHAGVYAAFGSITRAPKLERGAVTLVTQSGGFGYSIALACAEAGIGFRHVIATGNESDIDTIELIDALIDDEQTRCIVAYIEGTGDGRGLMAVGRRALAAGKPVLLWKGGVTAQGARAAASHTASLTGSYDFYRALFKQTGIVEIQELHEAVDFLKAMLPNKYPAGHGVAVMGVSGGSAIVFADAGERAGVHLSDLSEATQQRLAEVVPHIGAVHNPVDLTAGYFSKSNQQKLETAVVAALDDPGVHALCVNIATTGGAGALAAAEVLGRVSRVTDKPIVVFASAPRAEIQEALQAFADGGVAVLPSPSRAARVIAMLANYRELRERLVEECKVSAGHHAPTLAERWSEFGEEGAALSEAASKSVLARAGVSVTHDVIVQSAAEAAAAFDTMKGPVVVKIVSADIPHKTEIGGVVVGVQTREALETTVADMLVRVRERAPNARIDGVLLSPMIRGGFELIAGVVNDEVFGPVVVVGAGGIHTEILPDSTCRLAPFNEATARQMLDELRCRPILDGVRGGPALDVAAAAKSLAALSAFAWAARDRVQEVDLNPLFVLPEGAVAADALIVPKQGVGTSVHAGH